MYLNRVLDFIKEVENMVRKQTDDYFDTFVVLMEYSYQTASLLNDMMNGFSADLLQEKLQKSNELEIRTQATRSKTVQKLMKEFITPIEREDIILIADSIGNIQDAIGNAIKQLYMLNIRKLKGSCKKMAQIILECCNLLKEVFAELSKYKKSKVLYDLIINVNYFKKENEKIFIEAVRNLYINTKNVMEISSWYKIYNSLKTCCDECQKTAKAIEYMVLKNS